jgi:hypothetical protein
MSRFLDGKPPAGYTGSGPVKPPTGPRGPIKPKPGKPAPSTGGRGPVTTNQLAHVAANLVNQFLLKEKVVSSSSKCS